MVFYRKYRPQTIDNLDNASVRETLYAVLQKNVPHAFLFTGPKGLGKTSTARIVAKVVNCTTQQSKRGNGLEPCNQCDQCVSITNGTNVDVLEIDAASNRGIDEIRELKEKIRLSPVAAKRKVYIIDEVHMLTTEAFNALLKTLEEPPDHAMFILCTTEAHKVPETIVSRCFQIMFKPATEEELVRSFKRIIEEEKIDITDEALEMIARSSDGGFRDGVKLLEEMSLLANGKPITKELIDSSSRIFSAILITQVFLSAMRERDVKKSLELVQQLVEQGIDIKYFINNVLDTLHNVLLLKMEVSEKYKSLLVVHMPFRLEEIKNLIKLFSKAYIDMKYAVLPQLPLEIVVIEWCSTTQGSKEKNDFNQNVIPAKVLNANIDVGSPIKSGMTNEEVSVSSLRKQVGTMKKLKALYGTPSAPAKKDSEEEISITTTSVELMHTNGDGPVTKEWMEAFWRGLIDEMKKQNHTVAGVLRGCTIKSYADQKLIIQTAYKFHKERLDDMKNHDSLVKISKLLTGKDVSITIELRKN